MMRARGWSALALVLALGACGDEEKKKEDESCDPADPSACEDGLLCEQLEEGKFDCLPPVIVSGRVYDALSEDAIADATVVGLDANGAARTRVARSGLDGRYELPVSMRRNKDGSPIEESITLRVAAGDHQPFPTAPRTALPVELEKAVAASDADAGGESAESEWPSYRVENAATSVALIPLPADQRGGATVSGRVAAEDAGGVLVLAVASDRARSSAVSDQDGAFVLFNVPTGAHSIEGYRAGLALAPESVSVPAGGLEDVVLEASDEKLSTVEGKIEIVNPGDGSDTSVILVLASTFDENVARGEAPAGLRAGDVSGDFTIEDVPPGTYKVLAAFENDALVRDPDESIGGTEIVTLEVGTGGGAVTIDQSFKVTGALGVVSPGAEDVEEVAAGNLTLKWLDDSSEDGYEVRVYNALGELVHEDTAVARVTGSAEVSYALDASTYDPGMLYQFRVWSFRDDKGAHTYISASEDLRGVFLIGN